MKYASILTRTTLILIISVWIILLVALQTSDGLGTDFYPIYRAGKALPAHENPYGAAFNRELARSWHVAFADAGFAYPLPAVTVFIPLSLLPLPIAIVLWTGSSTLAALASVRLREDWRRLIVLPFVYMPLHRAVVMNQATLVWFALTVLLLFALRERWIWAIGLCIALLPAKPQNGLLFSLVGLVIAWRTERRALVWAAGCAALIWGGSFLIQPDWVQGWFASINRYNEIVRPISLLPMVLLLPLACVRLPWYALVAALQVALFPLSDVYSFLPLLLVWIAIGGRLALYGSAISWLWQFLSFATPMTNAWVYILIPLVLCAVWRSYRPMVHQRFGSATVHQSGDTPE